MKAYHFTKGNKLRDGRPLPAIGEWLEHVGPIVPCESGLHASEHPFDALQYSPGEMLHLVEIDGELVTHGDPPDKVVGRRRRIIASIDATDLLREFARCLWACPPVVRQYLETGDESIRAADWAADWAAAWDAARTAARTAAWDATRDAAWDAARDADRAAAWDAARTAARTAAWDATRDAAWDAARDADRAAAWDSQRAKFKAMVDAKLAK